MREAIQRTLDDLERQRVESPDGARPVDASGHPLPVDRNTRMFAVGPDTAKFLNTLIHATGARSVLEIGGSMGYSTIWMAEAVEANGGRLNTLEYVPEKAAMLRRRIVEAGVESTVVVHEGDALNTLKSLAGPWDLVLVDAWKEDYPAYFELVYPRLNVRGLMVADNITHPTPPGEGIEVYLEKARSQSNAQSQLLPIGSGLEVTVRLT